MSIDRGGVSRALYLEGGPGDAAHRQSVNAALGSLDLAAEVERALALKPGDALLDVACGTGGQLARWAAIVGPAGRAVGVDFSAEAIAIARLKVPEALVADAAQIPLEDAGFDALCCNYAIYYLDDPLRALREWRRLLRPGGRLVVTAPARDNNRALYDFHRRATGRSPGDADEMANGVLADRLFALFADAGFEGGALAELENRIAFPTAAGFLDYWRSTSLFLRTVPPAGREQAIRRAGSLLAQEPAAPVIVKKVTLAHAIAAGG